MSAIIVEDIFEVQTKDKHGKVFDKGASIATETATLRLRCCHAMMATCSHHSVADRGQERPV